MPSVVRVTRLVVLTFLAGLTACTSGGTGDSVTGPPPRPVTVVSGAGIRDTVLARHPDPLVLEIHDASGSPARGVIVQLTPRASVDTTRKGELPLYVCAGGATQCGLIPGFAGGNATLVDTTDGSGRARAIVRFGTVAGPGYVLVDVPSLGVHDSVEYTVVQGSPVTAHLPVHDVTLSVGGQRAITGVVTDAWGNVRSETPTYTLSNAEGAAAFDPTSTTVTAQAFGTARVVARYGAGGDSATVHVVPGGRLVLWNDVPKSLVLTSVDGSAMRVIATNVNSSDGVFPHFRPGGDEIVLHQMAGSGAGTPARVVVLDTLTGAIRQSWSVSNASPAAGLLVLGYPRELADGTVLAVGRTITGYDPLGPAIPGAFALFRLTAAGGLVQLAVLPGASATVSGAFDVSPDGSQVAYVTADGATGPTTGLTVLDVATGRRTVVDAQGSAPRWSPTGDRIAYLATVRVADLSFQPRLAVVAPDGSGRTLIGAGVYLPGIAWSPDGTYLLGAERSAGLQVARTRDGREVALRYPGTVFPKDTATYLQPDWR